MRDGVKLALDLVWPDGHGPFPVVLIRTPYDKVFQRDAPPEVVQGLPYDPTFLASLIERGYLLAVQDVRGRFNSDGDWYPYFNEGDDGFDTIEWIVAQPWCNGNVGMIGRSYVGYTQWMAAAPRPRGLKAIVPIGAQSDLFRSFPVLNGAFVVPMAELLVKMGRHSYQVSNFMTDVLRGSETYFQTLPLADVPAAAGAETPQWWVDMMAHPNFDAYWRRGSYDDRWSEIEAPALNVTGWYDLTVDGAITNFEGMRRHGRGLARSGQRLVVGPWAHWVNTSSSLSGFDFGNEAVIDLAGYVQRFFDRWLKGVSEAIDTSPHVHVFVMGAGEWWADEEWPLPGTEYASFYLRSDGRAHGDDGGGRLAGELPGTEPPDRYVYDPLDAVPSPWSMHDGPLDERPVAARPDVLCYTSEPLEAPLDVVGPLSLVLYASSSARDTDWHVRLADVHPDGFARFLAHGVLRARFRNSLQDPVLLTPGEIERFEIGLAATGNRFLPGHRIRLEVMSSWFPRFDRNLGSGAENNFLDAQAIVAEQAVFHTESYPSHLLLPVVRSGRRTSTPPAGARS